MITYSKIKFYPLQPAKEDISIIDIAHALSLISRANGHLKHFYSVAQHSINCCKEAKNRGYSEKIQLACLLHDASESYISDIIRPVKKNLPNYFLIESKLQQTIYEHFGLFDLDNNECQIIGEVDDMLLHQEFEELMDIKILDCTLQKSDKFDFSLRDCRSIEKEFLNIFHLLQRDRKS